MLNRLKLVRAYGTCVGWGVLQRVETRCYNIWRADSSYAKKPQIFRLEAFAFLVDQTGQWSNFFADLQAIEKAESFIRPNGNAEKSLIENLQKSYRDKAKKK
ncbi:hypothetical protein [Mucilaginibacter sp.]|uniref:hypothetical protein n=1 Tax=Mucilaginibacter sp. TaxID=1882438 RepID=UPI002613210F|nr:hypothetical protein [Mucilaginibacter sp.]